jgi:hypothetical protein
MAAARKPARNGRKPATLILRADVRDAGARVFIN